MLLYPSDLFSLVSLYADGFSYHQVYLRWLNWAPLPPQAETYGPSALRYPMGTADLLVAPGQCSLGCLMDEHRHPPSSLNHNPGHAAGCDLHRAMTPLEQLWKRLTRDLPVVTGGSIPLRGPVPTDSLWRCPEHMPWPSFGSSREPGHCNTPERLKVLSLTGWWVRTQQCKPIIGEHAKEYPEEIPN